MLLAGGPRDAVAPLLLLWQGIDTLRWIYGGRSSLLFPRAEPSFPQLTGWWASDERGPGRQG